MKQAIRITIIFCLLSVIGSSAAWAFFGPKGKDVEQKRATVRKERDNLLQAMFEKQPELKNKVAQAAGYATFSTVNVNLLLLASNNGYGVVMNNQNRQETFMRVASLGGGIGAGIRDMKVLFVFNEAEAMERFVEQGWQFGGQADATATSGDKGVALGEELRINPDTKQPGASVGRTSGLGQVVPVKAPVEIYQITEAGIALQATVSGTKYWKDADLNQ